MFGLAWSILAYPLFKSISFIVAVTNSYFWNRLWVFKSGRGDRGKEFLSFMVVSLIGLAINVGLASYVFLKIPPLFGLSQVLWANAGVLAALIASLIWNFFGYKLFVFHK
jgi:putative flippase GtrA